MKLIAPELLTAECANILWKKVLRGELTEDEALFAVRLLQALDIELLPTQGDWRCHAMKELTDVEFIDENGGSPGGRLRDRQRPKNGREADF